MQQFKIELNPSADTHQRIDLNDDVVNVYALEKWAKDFNLMTAGYRDQLDPEDIANPEVAINIVTMAILAEAKARVFKGKAADNGSLHVHIGGETRPHTQDFINAMARVYAANGFKVHLRLSNLTCPIWYSSFGVFYEGFQSGDNLTASHSQFFKGGWKPVDSLGKQLVEDEEDIIAEVQHIVRNRETIHLAPLSDKNIFNDFDVDNAYVVYQKTVIDEISVKEILEANENGFTCSICTVGGSMKNTSERLFHGFNISTGKDGIIKYFYDAEDSHYHNIGQINGENFGVDPTKKEIYRNIGAQEKLLNKEASLVFIWDPDGDRFNMITTAPSQSADKYEKIGLEVEHIPNHDKCIVYFTPNQIFFMISAYRIDAIKRTGLFSTYDWFLASSVTTSKALNELAKAENVPIVHVRVGFKHWGTFAEWLENRTNEKEPYTTALGEKVLIGGKPRLVLMCEESGGAILGGCEFIKNRDSSRNIIAMREKDAFQFGLMTLSLGAFLFNKNQSFADYYCSLIDRYNIQNRYFKRYDRRLYDEGLSGSERLVAKTEGEAKRDRIMQYFHDLADKYSFERNIEGIRKDIQCRLPKGEYTLPSISDISLIGSGGLLEGTFIQFESFWFVIRASGTDAVLRYYLNGKNDREIELFQKAIMKIEI